MRRTLLAAGLLATALGGCGTAAQQQGAAPPQPTADMAPKPAATTPARAKAVQPVVAAMHHHRHHRRAHRSVAASASPAPTAPAATAQASSGGGVSPGAPSDAQIRAELQQVYGGGGSGSSDASATAARRVELVNGEAQAPPDAPAAVQAIVAGADQVARLPYVYGGGHGRGGPDGTWIDTAYDCSGSVSFALANAGLVKSPMDSTSLSHWGDPGPGRWVTVYANAAHAFMVVGGVRFDTVGLQQSGSRWQPAYRSFSGFVARHPPGL